VLAGIGWMVLTTLLFACVTAIVRYIGPSVSAMEGAFLRYLFGAILVLPLLRPLLAAPPTRREFGAFALRGLLHGGGVILWFYAMARIPLAEVTALGYTAPLFVTVGAAVFFGEVLHARRLLAVAAGLLGALVILRPGFTEVSSGQLAQLAAAPLFAASYLLAKGMTVRGDPGVIVGMLSIFCTLVLLPGAVLTWTTPTLAEVALFALTAVFATAGHYTMTRALAAAPLTVTQPVNFLQLVWATTLGIMLFGEPIDPFVMLGGAIVVGAATFIARREAAAARRLHTPPPVALKS
jgi:drug/metabolite transporter (DMT)-like permease